MTIVRDIVEMEVTGLDNGLTKIVFSGRLDTPGVDRVEARFVARSLALRKAKLSLYGAQSMVNEVSNTST